MYAKYTKNDMDPILKSSWFRYEYDSEIEYSWSPEARKQLHSNPNPTILVHLSLT